MSLIGTEKVWFLCRLFNAKAILLQEQQWYYLTHSWEDMEVHGIPKGICPKVNVIARLEYDLTTIPQSIALRRPQTVHIYPTPPFGQDMTQGHFLSGVYRFEFRVFLLLD